MKITLKQPIIWFSPKASKGLKSLRPIFKELQQVHQDYINGEQSNRDCPYWYSERPQIGLLAAAAWRRGGTALEEYRADKTKGQKSKLGRCDLFIRINKNTEFECEAKRLWLRIGRNVEESCKKVTDCLNQAEGDVKKLPNPKGLALCFVTPVIHKSDVHALDTRLREWIKLVRDTPQYDALLWIRVPKGQEPIDDKSHKYLGLLLAVKAKRNKA